MILIISATNRNGSNTLKIAKQYQKIAENLNIESKLLDLATLTSLGRDENFTAIERELLIPATKFLVISPEYNGSFSGILKLMIDTADIKNVFHGKKAALTGVATGRSGNLRGMDHLTNIFNHMKMLVSPNKLPLSGVQHLLDEAGAVKDENTIALMTQQLNDLQQL